MREIEVSIICAAYNHEPYLSDALDSFLEQETSFPYEVIVHDDASTDGTWSIIDKYQRQYPNIVKGIHQDENQYSQGNSILKPMLERASGRYVALCEGDDFWIDQRKLQKQFDVMENDEGLSLCVHASRNVNAATKKTKSINQPYKKAGLVELREICQAVHPFATNSYFMRADVFRDYFKSPLYSLGAHGDQIMLLHSASVGEIYYLPDIMSAYRMYSKSSINRRIAISKEWKSESQKLRDSRIELLEEASKIFPNECSQVFENGIKQALYDHSLNVGDLEDLKSNWSNRFASEKWLRRVRVYMDAYAPLVSRAVKLTRVWING